MRVKLIGHEQSVQEVKDFLSIWDSAVCTLDVHEIIKLCVSDVCLFDLSSEMQGLAAYQRLWGSYQQLFVGHLQVYRKDVCIHADLLQAFIFGYSKVDYADVAENSNMPWCRTTMCLVKNNDVWKVSHQHVSYPVSLDQLFLERN